MKRGVRRTLSVGVAISLGAVGLGLAGCERAGEQPASLMLTFMEQEHGSEPYLTRTLVTREFMRMDGGEDADDFVLFDRGTQTIYSVNNMNGNILVIEPRAVEEAPGMALELDEERVELGDALPEAVAGHDAQRHRFIANGEVCNEVVSVPGLYDEAVAAVGEFLTVLAGQHGASLAMVPPDMRRPCDLATHIYAPARHLEHGLPVWERSEDGAVGRYLTAHEPAWPVDEALFRLPESYERYSLGGF
ncbi:hypothetical protein HUS23_01320 [Ectothiorhodospiraceae bacterium 2226]|nr:hypothetical protein HUS23_01320 [Ectothiorhodospiraceae bacterium 2226]